MKYNLTVIVPFLNEKESIPILVKELNNFFSDKKYSAEVIFVDDGSNDGSVSILKDQSFKYFDASVISFSRNFGSHAALRAGILNASGNRITFMYADLQDPVDLIDQMMRKMDEGFDIVWCNREKTSYRFFEKVFSVLYNKLMRKFVTPLFPDTGFDVLMFNQKIKNELNEQQESNSSIFIQIMLLGFNQASINYIKIKRRLGKSKWTLSKKIKLFIDSFVAFSYAPIRFVTIMGILFFICGMVYALCVILYSVFIDKLMLGWPTLIFLIMIGFGTTNISLGIIAEFLWRTLDASRKRKVFIINEIFKLNKE